MSNLTDNEEWPQPIPEEPYFPVVVCIYCIHRTDIEQPMYIGRALRKSSTIRNIKFKLEFEPSFDQPIFRFVRDNKIPYRIEFLCEKGFQDYETANYCAKRTQQYYLLSYSTEYTLLNKQNILCEISLIKKKYPWWSNLKIIDHFNLNGQL